MSPLPDQRHSPDLEDLLFAVDAAKSSVVLHVETSEGVGEFSISRGILRGAAFGEATGAMALHRVLDVGAEAYRIHTVSEMPVAEGSTEPELAAGARLSDLLSSRTKVSAGRSGFFMRSRLVRTPLPLPGDLPTLQFKIAERLRAGAPPLELAAELGAPPEDFLRALRQLLDRGLVAPSSASSPPTSRPFSSTLQSASETLVGSSEYLLGAPASSKPAPQRDPMASTYMAGSFPSVDLASPKTLRDTAPPEARAQSDEDERLPVDRPERDEPLPSHSFAEDVLDELGGLNQAIHSSRKPSLSGSVGRAETPSNESLPIVGRYEVLGRIKSGGVGSVYLCRTRAQAKLQRLFAMKVLRFEAAHDSTSVQTFFREARVLGRLHHPNVIGIVDAGSEQEPYLVLDYVEGGSLQELCQASPHARDPAAIVSIVLDALAGAEAVHRATDESGKPLGLVHHDLTAHNLLVGVDGACRVADFGVARVSGLGSQEVLRGKPGYVAPERYLGTSDDHRSDLFSLGVVLYTALCGVEPFAGASAKETRARVLSTDPAPPSAVGLRPPPCFDWVCLKALARDPNQRFQSAEEMMVGLRRIAAREDLLGSPSQVTRWVRAALEPRLRQRRDLLSPRGKATASPEEPDRTEFAATSVAPAPDFTQAAPRPRIHSRPPSSYAAREKTEVLPEPSPDAAADRASPIDVPKRSKKGLYITLLLVIVALGFIFLLPQVSGGWFSTLDEQSDTSQTADDEVDAPGGEVDVVLPAIEPSGH